MNLQSQLYFQTTHFIAQKLLNVLPFSESHYQLQA